MMHRALLIGEGQLLLFDSLDRLTNYIEYPEVESGKYSAYTEDASRWKLDIEVLPARGRFLSQNSKIVSPKLDAKGEEVERKILREVTEFLNRCGQSGLSVSFDNAFDLIQEKFGFTT